MDTIVNIQFRNLTTVSIYDIIFTLILERKEADNLVRLKIKSVAEAQGIDAARLSRIANIGYATAYRLFNEPELDETSDKNGVGILTLKRIARALGVKLTDLIEEDWLTLLIATGSNDTNSRAEVEALA